MNEKNDELPGPVSRRDFLRRAGKEAVTTGASMIPGAKLATAALGVANGKANWWQKLAKWRQGSTPEQADEIRPDSEPSHEA